MVDVNAGTALWLTQAVAPHMRQRGSGAIVHVAARQGLEPTAGMATYGVSKAALVHLTRLPRPGAAPRSGSGSTPSHRNSSTRRRTGRICLPTCWPTRSRREAIADRHRLPRQRLAATAVSGGGRPGLRRAERSAFPLASKG